MEQKLYTYVTPTKDRDLHGFQQPYIPCVHTPSPVHATKDYLDCTSGVSINPSITFLHNYSNQSGPGFQVPAAALPARNLSSSLSSTSHQVSDQIQLRSMGRLKEKSFDQQWQELFLDLN
jgi:hypothetical protein